MPQIVVAGASGYVGQALIPRLLARFPDARITALSRSGQSSDDSRVAWVPCDLFSLRQLEQAIPSEIDLAIYLVHSMGPTAQLDQGTFSDYDLILADNFARAVQRARARQIIYLGGLIPEGENLSAHLRSRWEVEETFRSYPVPTTVLRAGIILGDSGSSTQILFKLVKRLPVMICPSWTRTLTSPVLLEGVLEAITSSSLDPARYGRVFDLAGCCPLTYLQMMQATARRVGRRRLFFSVPVFTPTLSRLWVSLITNTPKNLVYPLIESLAHPMVARPDHAFFADVDRRTYSDLLAEVSTKTYPRRTLFRFRPKGKTVRSVQRLPLPLGKNAEWVKERYVAWLPQFLGPFIKVRREGDRVVFSFLRENWVLLELTLNPERSGPDRQLLYLGKGWMIARENVGRLEFRVVLNRQYLLAAIHDFTPSLPWYIYRFTQARLHLWVMRAFSRALRDDSLPPVP